MRFLSVDEIRELTKISTHLAYGLLAVSLLLLSPRTLLIAALLIVFGTFWSGIEYWAYIASGPPYLWAVLQATILAFLKSSRWASLGAVRIFSFTAGTVSSYVWPGDGYTFLALTSIGVVSYFIPHALDMSLVLLSLTSVSCRSTFMRPVA